MPTLHSLIWSQFIEYCEKENFDETCALTECLGDQQEFEKKAAESSTRFDIYLSEQISSRLVSWKTSRLFKKESTNKNDIAKPKDDPELITIDFSEAEHFS